MIYIFYFLSIPVIALFDYFLFRKWSKCDKCGEQKNGWYNYLIPTFVEVCLFLAGIAIGADMKL